VSAQAETFYATRCDFPECREVYDGGEYTYSADPDYNADLAREDGWLTQVGVNGADDYCPTHVVIIDCPPEGMTGDVDGDYCQWCEDHGTEEHLAPMPDTWENRLDVIARHMVTECERELDRVARALHDDLGPHGRLADRTDRALTSTWEAACRAIEPDVSAQTLWDLRLGRPRRDRTDNPTALAVDTKEGHRA
jgi:hypothetical protein